MPRGARSAAWSRPRNDVPFDRWYEVVGVVGDFPPQQGAMNQATAVL